VAPATVAFGVQMSVLKPIREAAKSVVFKYTSLAAPRYPYNTEPIQLARLVNELERLKDVRGNVVEIGLARGMTARFLCEHIRNQKLEDTLTYYAIDTFQSFTEEDLDYEVHKRGKPLFGLKAFDYNDYEVWKKNFADFKFVKVIKSDCSIVDYDALAPLKLSFLDVDLYLPTQKTLPKLYKATVSGGAILVDDVKDNSIYDGAYQAYMEYCEELKVEPIFLGNKCGVIYKP
jgi:hypothetical protein